MDLQILTYVGLLTVAYCLYKFASGLYSIWRIYFASNNVDFSEYGTWSVVTGPTSGFGECIANQLASRGQNIILIARNKHKLENVANDIAAKYGVATKYLVIDFLQDDAIYDEIKDFLKDYDIGVLVNNVAIGHVPGRFLNVLANYSNICVDLIRVNVLSYCKMTEIVLPGMIERHRGIILNVSSIIVDRASYSLYGASKMFEYYFAQSLSYEYESSGVTIQSCTPSFFASNMTQKFPVWMKRLFISPEYLAESLFTTIGKERRTYGCWQHALQAEILKILPLKLYQWMLKTLWVSYKDINKVKSE